MCLALINATFNNISVISCRSVLLMEETGVPEECHRSDNLNHKMLHGVQLAISEIRTHHFIGDRH